MKSRILFLRHRASFSFSTAAALRTQTRATQIVQIQNTPLRAMLTVLRGGTNTAVETTLQFEVQANRADIARIDLFSTGGWLASATNLDSATFSIGGTNLGVGLHPFYAMVIAGDGAQYRTEIKSIRLAGLETSLALAISAQPVTLTWPAVPGRFYDVLASDAVSGPFQVEATLLASDTGSLTWRAPPPWPAASTSWCEPHPSRQPALETINLSG